jgi:hypothetical protein
MTIDLSGPQGNAFFLLGMAARIAREMELPANQIQAQAKRLKAGNYNQLLDTLEREFPGIDFEFLNDPREAQPTQESD